MNQDDGRWEARPPMHRTLIPTILALVLVPSTVITVLRRMPEVPSAVLAFPRPTHRVAVAVDEAMRAERASVTFNGADFLPGLTVAGPNTSLTTGGEISEDLEYFWSTLKMPGQATAAVPMLMSADSIKLQATTREGRSVEIEIREDPIAGGSLVDFHGDSPLATALSAKIADRLAHPKYKHESPEDREALMVFFGMTKEEARELVGKIKQTPPNTAIPAMLTPPGTLSLPVSPAGVPSP